MVHSYLPYVRSCCSGSQLPGAGPRTVIVNLAWIIEEEKAAHILSRKPFLPFEKRSKKDQ